MQPKPLLRSDEAYVFEGSDPLLCIRFAARTINGTMGSEMRTIDEVLPEVIFINGRQFYPRDQDINKKRQFVASINPRIIVRRGSLSYFATKDEIRAGIAQLSFAPELKIYAAILTLFAPMGITFTSSHMRAMMAMGSFDTRSMERAMETVKRAISKFIDPVQRSEFSLEGDEEFNFAFNKVVELTREASSSLQHLQKIYSEDRVSRPFLCNACADPASRIS